MKEEIEAESASQDARDSRIRAEIEALHQARIEQRQRIEARTLHRNAFSGGSWQSPRRRADYSPVAPTFFAEVEDSSKHRSHRAGSRAENAEDFQFITSLFDDPSTDVRNLAARALYRFQSDRAATFTQALREASPDRRRRIGAAVASSGLATDALASLAGENENHAYDAFSVLFLMAKAGEVECLIKEIENGRNLETRLAVVKLLALSGQSEVVTPFRRMTLRSSLPAEVRGALIEAIHQLQSKK